MLKSVRELRYKGGELSERVHPRFFCRIATMTRPVADRKRMEVTSHSLYRFMLCVLLRIEQERKNIGLFSDS